MTIMKDFEETKKQIAQNISFGFFFLILRNGNSCLKGDRKELVPSSDLKVGDILEIKANQRIPADLVILYTP